MTAPARFCRHPDLRLAALEGEGVVLHLGARKYFTVSETGLVLLDLLEEPRTLDQLVTGLMERYAVDRDHADTSTQQFLERCRAAGLILEEA